MLNSVGTIRVEGASARLPLPQQQQQEVPERAG